MFPPHERGFACRPGVKPRNGAAGVNLCIDPPPLRVPKYHTALRVNRSLPSIVAAGRLNDAVPDRQWRRNTRLSAVSVLTAGLRSGRNSGHAGIGAVERRRRRWGRLRRRWQRRDTHRNHQKCSRWAKHCFHPALTVVGDDYLDGPHAEVSACRARKYETQGATQNGSKYPST